jgi:ABC-type bacteriocin/lantibiotic exporter with double-glycine peptidase domain
MRGLYPSMAVGPTHMKAVLQEDLTGCGIACVATLANVSYQKVKSVALTLGIDVGDTRLWSHTAFVRILLNHYGIQSLPGESPFRSWQALPPLALLATKWHRKNNQAFWHWVIYWKRPDGPVVLDSKFTLRNHVRTDFGRIKPRWFITVHDRI